MNIFSKQLNKKKLKRISNFTLNYLSLKKKKKKNELLRESNIKFNVISMSSVIVLNRKKISTMR